MGFFSDLKILYQMAIRPIRGKEHAERLESFYGSQAESYDDFRKRLLKGREKLWSKIPFPSGGVWIDMGGGTGVNLENFALSGEKIGALRKVYVVDLAESLLRIAQKRADQRNWSNVETVRADATTWIPTEKKADTVTFSYSLTMIPDWFAAIDHAYDLLKPGGIIGVVDFYLSRKFPAEGRKRHGYLARSLWPAWFSCDNVFPSRDHLPYLTYKFEPVFLEENAARVPYHPCFWAKMPYYLFVGKKPEE